MVCQASFLFSNFTSGPSSPYYMCVFIFNVQNQLNIVWIRNILIYHDFINGGSLFKYLNDQIEAKQNV